MSTGEMARRAATAAMYQRLHGDRRPLRVLFGASFSLLRYMYRRWGSAAS